MQLDDALWDALIGDLYDAVLQPDQLGSAVRRFESVVQSDGCHLFATDAQMNPLLHVWTLDWADEQTISADYYAHYIHLDPRRAHMLNTRVGEALQCSQIYDERYVQRSEFYQDCLIASGGRYVAGGKVLEHLGMVGFAAFNRTQGRPDFNAQEMAMIRRYTPHLARVVRMLAERQQWHLQAVANEEGLSAQRIGVIALAATGRVLYANACGERQISELGQLRGALLQLEPTIQSAVAAAHATQQPQSLQWLGRVQQRMAVQIWSAPRSGRERWLQTMLPGTSGVHTLLLIRPLGESAAVTASMLMQVFALTAAEARLAQALVGGATLDDCAQRFCVSINTVRTQLRGVLGKTGCKRQADLVRLLMGMSSVLT